MKNFALLGVAGYIAPRHLRAIKDSGNKLIVAYDNNDSVGIIDSYFPDSDFFTEFERFDRHLEKLKFNDISLDYMSICTPNYLHDAHIRVALRRGADAICEKPLVLNPWNIDALARIQEESKKRIYNILQLRLHPDIEALKRKVEADTNQVYDIDLTYITSRGNWYGYSWKGDINKSGGIATNIGVHFFDMLAWIFGNVEKSSLHYADAKTMSGSLRFKNANVRWFLSIDENHLPTEIANRNQRTYRSIEINGDELEFSSGFTDLHLKSYENILKEEGFELEEARQSIEIVHEIRQATPSLNKGEQHPFIKKIQ